MSVLVIVGASFLVPTILLYMRLCRMNDYTAFMSSNNFAIKENIIEMIVGLPKLGKSPSLHVDHITGKIRVLQQDSAATLGLGDISGKIKINGQLIDLSSFALLSVKEDKAIGVKTHIITLRSQNFELDWCWHLYETDKGLYLLANLHNHSSQPMEISNWQLLTSSTGQDKPKIVANPDKSCMFKWNTWDMGVEELASNIQPKLSENIFHLYDPLSQSVVFCGFLTMSRMQTRHAISFNNDDFNADYHAECLFGDFCLQPDDSFNSEILAIAYHDDPYEILENWAEQARYIYKPKLAEIPPVGWCGSSWASAKPGSRPSWEEYAVSNANAIRERLAGFDVGYIWTSQSNLKDFIPGNWLSVNESEIPSGLTGFFSRLQEMDYKPGLWVSPFWFYGEAENILDELKENLLYDKDGQPICREEVWGWRYNDDLPWYHMHRYFLDGTHPASLDYIDRLFSYYRQIGVRYYMLDFLGIIEGSQLYNKKMTPHQAGYSMLQQIRESSGDDAHIQTAVSSSPGFTGTISSARIGRDFGEGRPLEGNSLSDWRNATHVLHDLHYANTKYFLKNIAANYFTHQKIYLNDLNLMTIDRPYPTEHARIVATLFGVHCE